MSIGGVVNSPGASSAYKSALSPQPPAVDQKTQNDPVKGAVYEKSTADKINSRIYSKEEVSKVLKDSASRQQYELQQLFAKSLGQQSGSYKLSKMSARDLNAVLRNATPADIQSAQAAIAEGGAFSVDAVATRIMDMAKAFAGSDPEKLEVMRNAVQKGFDQARGQLGELPGICNDTYDSIMKQFDVLTNSAKASQQYTGAAATVEFSTR